METSTELSDDTNSLEGFDVASVVADIGRDLAGPSEGSESIVDEPAVEAKTAPVEQAPEVPAITQGQNSVAKPLPKSWKKDMAPIWDKLPPEAHDYVYEREANVMRGFQQYQAGNDAWQNLVKPFEPIFKQNPSVNPIGIMQGLMNTHLQLLNPSASPEKKSALARQIMQEYGISLDGSPPAPESALQQEIQFLKSELSQIKSSWTQRQEQEHQAEVQKHIAIIDAFAKDPKNEFFNELSDDIHRFIQTGAAKDIASAYDLAAWANPSVRAKLIAKQQTPPIPAKAPPAVKPAFVNLESDNTPRSRPRKPGTIDDTINSIVQSHYSKH